MSYASIRREAFEDAASQHGLSLAEQAVLARLLLLADWRTGIHRCTQTGLAEAFGIQRHNLRPKLTRLTDAGLIDCYFPKGHNGAVRVLAYLDLVHIAPSQEPKQSLRKD